MEENRENKDIQPEPLPSSQDKNDVEEFYNSMKDQKQIFFYMKNLDVDLLAKGIKLIEIIRKEYHLG